MNKSSNLDYTSLLKALSSLNEAVTEFQKQNSNAFIRDASIQRFEYSYELTHKMLKRFLEMTEPSAEEIDQMSFQNLIRTGAERGLLQNSWDKWSVYRHARNLTSHTYDESKAIEVCSVIPDFLQEAQYFLAQLQSRVGK
jgi:nucleotidyltransferase substrate binding protein (TIGR01987 family)